VAFRPQVAAAVLGQRDGQHRPQHDGADREEALARSPLDRTGRARGENRGAEQRGQERN